jgi:hypothetical protein
MTSEKRFKQKDAEIGIFDAFHAGFVVPLAAFLDGESEQKEEEAQEDEAVIEVETPKPAKPKKEEPTPTQEESELADDNADAE